MSETTLQAARAGDKNALELLLKEVEPKIYRFGLRMCRHAEDAEDVLQETLLTVASQLENFRGESSLSTWAYSIARGHCSKKRRADQRLRVQGDPAAVDASQEGLKQAQEDALRSVQNKESWEDIASALAQLDPAYRELIILRDIEGLSATEVATILQVSVPTVKSKLHRARRALRETLGQAERFVDCPDIIDAFSRFLEGELSQTSCAQMQSHLDECPRCQGVCNALKQDLKLCQLAPAEEVPKEISLRIVEKIKTAL